MKHFCGRDFSGQEMRRLCDLIGQDPTRSRAQISRLAWFKPDGGLKKMSCRVAMMRMHELGLIQLPTARIRKPVWRIRNTARSDPQTSLDCPVTNSLRSVCYPSTPPTALLSETNISTAIIASDTSLYPALSCATSPPPKSAS